jgi:hypothetical protein
MSTFAIGTTYEIDPLPLVAEDTTLFDAGAITIGVEYRRVDGDTLRAGFGDLVTDEDAAFDDVGVSLHVLRTADLQEFLRFDCFDKDAHYHYILWGTRQTVVPFDRAACGDMLTWALEAIGERLTAMLTFAGAPELAAEVDPQLVRAALERVTPVAREAQRAGRAVIA